jgi:hypothetical protein
LFFVDDPDIPTSEIVNILDRAALSPKIFRKKSKIKTNNYKWFDNDLRSKQKTLVEKGELLSRYAVEKSIISNCNIETPRKQLSKYCLITEIYQDRFI